MKLFVGLVGVVLTGLPDIAVAQALDSGSMVGWAGGAAVQYDLQHRRGDAAPARPMSASEAEARHNCTNRYTLAQRLGGIDSPASRRLFALCAKAGYY